MTGLIGAGFIGSGLIESGLIGAAVAGAGWLLVPALVRRVPPHDRPDVPSYGDAIRSRWGLLWSVGLGALVGARLDWSAVMVAVLVLVPLAVALAIIDQRTHLLPKRLVLPATALLVGAGLLDWALTSEASSLVRAGLGLVLARSAYWLLWRVRPDAMGFGDVRLAAPIGFVLAHGGWPQLVVGLYAGFVLFAVPLVVVALARRDRAALRTARPFGPFMLAGAVVGLLLS